MLFFGGARAGKTLLIASKIIVRASNYPGSKHAVLRKTERDCKETVWLETFLPILKKLQNLGECKLYEYPAKAVFKNGSLIRIGGLHPSEIDKVLGVEYATVYVNEASETSFKSIEPLFSRLNDRSKNIAGKEIVPRFICDENPPLQNHWTFKMFCQGVNPATGKPIQDFDSYANLHFIPQDNIKNLADGYLQTLQNLSEAGQKRFLRGEFGTAEGLIFSEFDPELHTVPDFPIPKDWKISRGIDFGKHPGGTACNWIAYDKSNDIYYIYRVYKRFGLTGRENAKNILELSFQDIPSGPYSESDKIALQNRIYSHTVADHQSEYRDVFDEMGITTTAAIKNVNLGIDWIKELLQKNKLKIFQSCQLLVDEIYGYVYRELLSGEFSQPTPKDNLDDHAIDSVKYNLNATNPRLLAGIVKKGIRLI